VSCGHQRIHALLALSTGIANGGGERLHLSEQTVRGYVTAFLLRAWLACAIAPPGRPAKLTRPNGRELAALLRAGPEAAGYGDGLLDQPVDPGRDPPALWRHYHPTTCVNCWIAWASRSRKRVLSPITSMKPDAPAWHQQTWPEIWRWRTSRRP